MHEQRGWDAGGEQAQLSRSGPNFACIQREYQTAEMKKQEINKEERGQRRDHGSALIES